MPGWLAQAMLRQRVRRISLLKAAPEEARMDLETRRERRRPYWFRSSRPHATDDRESLDASPAPQRRGVVAASSVAAMEGTSSGSPRTTPSTSRYAASLVSVSRRPFIP